MISEVAGQTVYLAKGATDLRKAVDGLAAIVQLEFALDPFAPCLFVFCNRRRDKLKILQWSEAGFWLHYHRLEKGRFQWPDEDWDGSNPLAISWRELRWIIDGLPLKPAQYRKSILASHVL